MRRLALGLQLTLLLALTTFAAAEPRLLVNGRDLAGSSATLVPGTSYAPGVALAQALGADLVDSASRDLVTLQVGGRVLQLAETDGSPAPGGTNVWLDGRPTAGGPAVRRDGELFLPVKAVAEALGASVTYLQSEDTVMVVQPRGRLTAMRLAGGSDERLEIAVSAPVRYTTFFNEPLGTLHVYFDRTDIDVRLPAVEGQRLQSASASAKSGAAEVRVQLRPGTAYRVYAVPDGRGFRLNVSARSEGEQVEKVKSRIVLDPGHGGPDTGVVGGGFGSESTLVLAFSERLAASLEGRGYAVTATRRSDAPVEVEERTRAGVGSALFLSLHAAELDVGEFRAYYLGDAGNVVSLEMAVRENAAAASRDPALATDALRRELLLGLVPDLDVGRRVAEALAGRLFTVGGYRADSLLSAPLQVLGGAAGRGVLLEFSPADLASDGLPDRLADAIDQLFGSGLLGEP